MRVALLTEGVRPHAAGGTGDWCDRLVDGLREHDFERYVLTGEPAPAGRVPGGPRRRRYAAAHEQFVRALLIPGERAAFGPALYRLADLARADRALPAFLASAHARRILERVWRSAGAATPAGRPLVRDVLAAADLLEQCLRPLSAPWYGTDPGGLGAADLCHVVGGGPAALPALVAKHLHGVPFVVTEHGPHLREQYLRHGGAGHRCPVRALLLGHVRALTEETYRQAAALTPGSAHDQGWQLRCGADPARIRVVHEGTPAVDRPAAGPEPAAPTLVWAGPLEPDRDPGPLLQAFARVRAELPAARLVVHGEETVPGYRAHCGEVAARLGVAPSVGYADRSRPAAEAWAAGSVAVFTAPSRHRPRLLTDAMLSGRAVVATDVGVTREVVGPTGLLVPPLDPRALAGACLALLRDAERRARLGLAGRLRAQERFGVEPVTGAFREIYLDLVSHWPAFPATAPGARPFARPAEYWLADRGALRSSGVVEAGGSGGVPGAVAPGLRAFPAAVPGARPAGYRFADRGALRSSGVVEAGGPEGGVLDAVAPGLRAFPAGVPGARPAGYWLADRGAPQPSAVVDAGGPDAPGPRGPVGGPQPRALSGAAEAAVAAGAEAIAVRAGSTPADAAAPEAGGPPAGLLGERPDVAEQQGPDRPAVAGPAVTEVLLAQVRPVPGDRCERRGRAAADDVAEVGGARYVADRPPSGGGSAVGRSEAAAATAARAGAPGGSGAGSRAGFAGADVVGRDGASRFCSPSGVVAPAVGAPGGSGAGLRAGFAGADVVGRDGASRFCPPSGVVAPTAGAPGGDRAPVDTAPREGWADAGAPEGSAGGSGAGRSSGVAGVDAVGSAADGVPAGRAGVLAEAV
ncbi:DUF3492 domain-containing protein [Kitasatospora sp. NPDC058115]|uniref:DUF3492 domain-containing protein n=1 Tax=Kitasatospora sp. NPDC058115 TaxID=3346347 RepID=UPI0036D852FE